MTGTTTAKGSTAVGGAIEAWDGYISGRNLKLVPGKRIVQAWRTTEFGPSDADSQIDVTLAKTARGTRVTLTHSNVPDGHTGYKSGWSEFYFTPMKAYFAAQTRAKAAAKVNPKTKAKPKVKAKAAIKPARKAKPAPRTAARKKR
jgi:uncharacterized protein YndB with AHSA1/START domain